MHNYKLYPIVANYASILHNIQLASSLIMMLHR